MFKRTAITALLLALSIHGIGCDGQPKADTDGAPSSVYIGPYDKPGFVTSLEDGRLWVFAIGSDELADYQAGNELAKHVTKIGVGPGGMTVKAPDTQTLNQYMASKRGFVTKIVDGNIWVFQPGSEELADFEEAGELAKHTTLVKKGPMGMTVKAPDKATAVAYITAKPGFVTMMTEEERLWVFRADSEELADYKQAGELAKHVIRPGAGPMGMTIKAPDTETLLAYAAAAPGFVSVVIQEADSPRVWVFRPGSDELAQFKSGGELAKHVTKVKAGPLGMTVKAPDPETANAYLRIVQK
jgi:hypothetical protein